VSFYKIDVSDFFYLKKGDLYLNGKLFENIVPSIENSNIADVSFYEKGLSINFNNGVNWLFFSEKNKMKIPYNSITSNIVQDKIPIYEYDFNLLTPLNNIYDLKLHSLVFSEWHKGGRYVISPDIYMYMYIKEISLYDLKNKKSIYFSIKDFPSYINGFGHEQEADIIQVIGLYNNLLWIHIGRFHLVGIDIKTGSMQCHIEDMRDLLHLSEEDSRYFEFSPFDKYAIHLDSENGLLKAFAHRYYIEINLNTLTGCVKKDFGKKTGESWRITNSLFYQERPNLLYFSGHYKSDGPNAYGIFDTEKSEIIWSALSNEDTGSFYTPPQANDRLLAVLDDKQNLFVYENV
jgi:hypothetical protein